MRSAAVAVYALRDRELSAIFWRLPWTAANTLSAMFSTAVAMVFIRAFCSVLMFALASASTAWRFVSPREMARLMAVFCLATIMLRSISIALRSVAEADFHLYTTPVTPSSFLSKDWALATMALVREFNLESKVFLAPSKAAATFAFSLPSFLCIPAMAPMVSLLKAAVSP